MADMVVVRKEGLYCVPGQFYIDPWRPVERAVITFRGQQYLVPVMNISARGTMIESEIMPRIGETIIVQFENCTKIHGFVRWIRDGRLGINFGHEIILG